MTGRDMPPIAASVRVLVDGLVVDEMPPRDMHALGGLVISRHADICDDAERQGRPWRVEITFSDGEQVSFSSVRELLELNAILRERAYGE